MSRPRIAFLVHGGPASIETVRAQGLASRLPEDQVRFLVRQGPRTSVARQWWRALRQFQPDLVYAVNTAMPGALVGPLYARRHRIPFVLDTGDAIHAMAKASGIGAGWRLPLLLAIENFAQRRAAAVVVRGTRHREHLLAQGIARVARIRDGYVDRGPVASAAVAAFRARVAPPDRCVLGVMGSLVLSPRLGICYGWDLVEALALLPDLPIAGLVIGDGNGQAWLEARAAELRVRDRIAFAGRIPYPEVQVALRAMDFAMSTQTNNLPGQVRTTGKLPEYMAAGRFILASRVGEAALLLPEPMLLDFHGTVDRQYPARLAARIREILARPGQRALADTLPELARRHHSYDVLSAEFMTLVESLAGRAAPARAQPEFPRPDQP